MQARDTHNAESTLIDSFGRQIEYLRLSVTDRCDLRCHYCMPKGFKDFEEPSNWLNFDELVTLVSAFSRLGLKRLRLTGGEPLVRRNLPELAARLNAIPDLEDLSLSTNGTQLHKHAKALSDAGVKRLNISLDSINRKSFANITGRDALPQVLDGLKKAASLNFSPIKINMVAMKGVNEDDIEPMLEFCIEHGFVLRLIEAMPMGETGQNTQYLDLQPIKKRLQERYDLVDGVLPGGGPARYLKTRDNQFSVGFITPMSQHFCETCNRVRLSVDGTLYLCLGQEDKFDFRPLLRAGISAEDLEHEIRNAIALKPERHEFKESHQKIVRFMSMTGG